MSESLALSADERERTIGITTTVPVEAIFAAGRRPMDLNNVFIACGDAGRLVEKTEQRGFPRNSCAWTKGVYAAARELGLKRVVGVVQGDCSNTHAVMEMLAADGVEVVPFAFPYRPDDRLLMDLALERFAADLGTTVADAETVKRRLDRARANAHRIDALNWREGRVTGSEQHVWTISCSDFFGDPDKYAAESARFLREAAARDPCPHLIRLGLVGIPPICDGFFEFLERHGARVVFNETPRQFAMPFETPTLADQYLRYTYPYDIFHRLPDIKREIERRRVDGIVHYVQSFCFRQAQDCILRRAVARPVLTLEGDRPGPLEVRAETRIEAFLEMLREKNPET